MIILIWAEVIGRHFSKLMNIFVGWKCHFVSYWPVPGCWDLFGARRSSPASNCFIHESPPLSPLPKQFFIAREWRITNNPTISFYGQHLKANIHFADFSVEINRLVLAEFKSSPPIITGVCRLIWRKPWLKSKVKESPDEKICSVGGVSPFWLQWRAERGIGSKWGVNWMMVIGGAGEEGGKGGYVGQQWLTLHPSVLIFQQQSCQNSNSYKTQNTC